MIRIFLVTLAISLLTIMTSFGQSEDALNTLLRNGKEVPKVLLVGTFHFGYPGLDDHKTDDANKLDINSPQRQKEIEELVDYIAKYKPTKVLVETGSNTGYLLRKYEAWKEGTGELRKREVDQVGFRLMDRFDLDTIYGIDANSFAQTIYSSRDSVQVQPIIDSIYRSRPDSLFESAIEDKYWEWYEVQDKRCVDMELLDFFLETNSDYHINRMHGHYLLSDKTDSYDSVDGLTLNWFSRNLRILKNIQMVETKPTDRILVLIGSGHVPILKQQFECTPEYELVKFGDL